MYVHVPVVENVTGDDWLEKLAVEKPGEPPVDVALCKCPSVLTHTTLSPA